MCSKISVLPCIVNFEFMIVCASKMMFIHCIVSEHETINFGEDFSFEKSLDFDQDAPLTPKENPSKVSSSFLPFVQFAFIYINSNLFLGHG